MKRILVYPCGTEIALEIHKALRYSKGYELIGGVDSSYDHGQFVFNNLIGGLPFIKDDSTQEDILTFERTISKYGIDFIYPAMDGVIAVFARFKDIFDETLIISEAAQLCRSKRATYKRLYNIIKTPRVFSTPDDIDSFPIFVKPDKGQGSIGAKLIKSFEELKCVDFDKNVVMEYLPGKEYTIDCFTNAKAQLIYAKGRSRKRIKNGISVNAVFENRAEFMEIAEKINASIPQKGGWFFQLKENINGDLVLLEVAARIAGASAISRNIGANLPLMTLDIFNGVEINDVVLNDYDIELDRALKNSYKISLKYSHVYVDYDDTVVQNGKLNISLIAFLYQCINNGIKITLLSKHEGNLSLALKEHRINNLFDEVIHLSKEETKIRHIIKEGSIFIDDSYGERKAVKEAIGIPVFDTHMIECLLEE